MPRGSRRTGRGTREGGKRVVKEVVTDGKFALSEALGCRQCKSRTLYMDAWVYTTDLEG